MELKSRLLLLECQQRDDNKCFSQKLFLKLKYSSKCQPTLTYALVLEHRKVIQGKRKFHHLTFEECLASKIIVLYKSNPEVPVKTAASYSWLLSDAFQDSEKDDQEKMLINSSQLCLVRIEKVANKKSRREFQNPWEDRTTELQNYFKIHFIFFS